MKNEPSEDAQSPYTDITVMDDEDKSKLAVPSSSPLSYSNDMRGVISGIATYVPQQKPEWKRYKQYTRNDILSAIEAVRNGMSALQAARKYGVPSRTLYDKVKKLGITTGRPFKRGSNGSNACFPYGISGTSSPYSHVSENDDYNLNHTALLEASASFLQHALDRSGGDVGEREALAAMAAVAAAQQASGNSTSPGNHGMARSPSPSPSLLKYMHQTSLTPSPPDEHHHETNGSSDGRSDTRDDQDQVEDLSISRKPEQSRVIMPPMKVSTIISKEEIDDRKLINSNKDIQENRHREIVAEEKE